MDRYANEGLNTDALFLANRDELLEFAEANGISLENEEFEDGVYFMVDLESGHVRNMKKASDETWDQN